jgi:hypothetical protein
MSVVVSDPLFANVSPPDAEIWNSEVKELLAA